MSSRLLRANTRIEHFVDDPQFGALFAIIISAIVACCCCLAVYCICAGRPLPKAILVNEIPPQMRVFTLDGREIHQGRESDV